MTTEGKTKFFLIVSRIPTHKYRKIGGNRKSFGNHCNNNYFRRRCLKCVEDNEITENLKESHLKCPSI